MRTALIALVLPAFLPGCMVGPDYVRPDTGIASDWQAALPHEGQTHELADWWHQFNDSTLDTLLQTAETDSPSLDAATVRITQARANMTRSASGAWPQLDSNASAIRSGTQRSSLPPKTLASAGLDASWEIDLFGAVRRANQASEARWQARIADWHDARVSLAAEVADNYVDYRACQKLVAAYEQEAFSQRETARLTHTVVNAGFSSPADGRLADAGVANASANWIAQRTECDVTLKSLVALTGLPEPRLRELIEQEPSTLPVPKQFAVTTLPVALLSQRPDLVTSERELAAASADIGVATADRYPRLSLLGSVSLSSISINSQSTQMTPWSFGPLLTLPIFDAGRRAAEVISTQARYDEALASYKQAVRSAVKETEQALVRLDGAAQRETDATTAAAGYRAYFNATETHWRAGGESLLNLELARRSAIIAEINLISLQRDRVRYWIALYKALGGGWQASDADNAPLTRITDTLNTSSDYIN